MIKLLFLLLLASCAWDTQAYHQRVEQARREYDAAWRAGRFQLVDKKTGKVIDDEALFACIKNRSVGECLGEAYIGDEGLTFEGEVQ